MLKLTKQSIQAIDILAECARAGNIWVLTTDAARSARTTRDRAAQLVRLLSIRGLIETRRGRHGG